jgi:hypothetical protein
MGIVGTFISRYQRKVRAPRKVSRYMFSAANQAFEKGELIELSILCSTSSGQEASASSARIESLAVLASRNSAQRLTACSGPSS